MRAREQAEIEREKAEQARRHAEEQAQKMRDAEQEALAKGQLRAEDLQRGQAWEVAVAAERGRLAQQVSSAAEREKGAIAEEGQARDALASSKADAEVVNKDKQRFVDRERRARESREEEAAAEVWRPKRG